MWRAAATATAGALLILVAFAFDAAPLFVAGVALGVLGAGAATWVTATALRASVQRTLSTDRVMEDEPLEAMLQVRCGPLGCSGEVVDPLTAGPVRLDGRVLRRGGQAEITVVTRFARRGRRVLEPPRLIVRDPLDLAARVRTGSGRQQLLILPRTEPIRWADGRGTGRLAAAAGRSRLEPLVAVEIDGLRPYRTGTPASRIHWPALARGRGLIERHLRADSEARPLVVLDSRGRGDAALDAAVRAAASLLLALARAGGCALLLSGERRPMMVESDLGGWPAAHARLALVDAAPDTRPPLLGAGERLGAVVYVSAQPLGRLPAALGGEIAGARLLVLPKQFAERTSRAPSFEVAGCYGFVLRAGAGWSGRRVA